MRFDNLIMLNKNYKPMKKILLLLVSIAISFASLQNLNAQKSALIKANKYYTALDYSKAIPYYERVLKKTEGDIETMIKLAECYRLTNDVNAAADMYAKVVNQPNSAPIYKYYYAQSLMSQGEHKKAEEYLKQYQEDSRSESFIKSINELSKYYKDSSNYTLQKAKFNTKFSDFSPYVLDDGRVIFISSRPKARLINYTHGWTGNNFTNIYVTEKNKKGKYKNPKMFSRKIQSHLNEGSFAFSGDMNTIYFTRNSVYNNKRALRGNDGKVKLQICQASYYPKKKKYKNVVEFEHNNTTFNYAHPTVSSNGQYIYFSSDRPGGYGGMDIWMCERQGDKWGIPVNLGEKINSPGNEVFPFLQANNKLYYSSDGLGGLGGLDIFVTKLNISNGKPFGKSFNMGAKLNSNADDFGIFFDKEGMNGYISSNRCGNDSNDDIFEFTMQQPVNHSIIIKGKAIDNETNKPVANAVIKLKNDKGEIIEQTMSDEKGCYVFEGEFDHNYNLTGDKGKYNTATSSASTMNAKGKNEIIADLSLEVIPSAKITLAVIDQKTKNPIEGVRVKLTDRQTGAVKEYFTNVLGTITAPLNKKAGENMIYDINLTHNEFLPKDLALTKTIAANGEVNVKEEMFKIEVGQDVGKALDLNPIYFDYDKFNIRPDAQVELDKIVKIMNEYPNMVIELGSHTDCRGKASYNMELSDKRAKASAAYVVSKGIDKSRIYGRGFGESKLVNDCKCEGKIVSDCSDEEHQMNRRTEFIIVKF